MVLSPTTALLAIQDNQDNCYIYDLHLRLKISQIYIKSGVYTYFLHPLKRQIIFSNEEGIYKQDVQSTVATKVVNGPLGKFALSPDGNYIAYANFADSQIKTVHYPNGESSGTLPLPLNKFQWIQNIFFNTDSKGILVEAQKVPPIHGPAGNDSFSLYYFPAARDTVFCIDRGVEQYNKIAFSPDSKLVAFSTYSKRPISIFRLDNTMNPYRTIDYATLVQPLDSTLRRRLVNTPQIISMSSDLFFIDEAALGICINNRKILRYDLSSKRCDTYKTAEQPVAEVLYPPTGNVYVEMNRMNYFEISMKEPDQPLLHITNRYFDPIAILPVTGQKTLFLTSRDARLIDLNTMKIDSTWNVGVSAKPLFQYYGSLKLFMYAAFRAGGEAIMATQLPATPGTPPSILLQTNANSYFYQFIADPARHLLITAGTDPAVPRGPNARNIVLQIAHTNGQQEIFVNRVFPRADFRKLLYDSIHQQAYLFFNSPDNLFQQYIFRIPTIANKEGETFEYSSPRFEDATIDPARGVLYTTFQETAGKSRFIVRDLATMEVDTVIPLSNIENKVAVDYTGDRVIIGDGQGILSRYDPGTKKITHLFNSSEGAVQYLEFTGDGRLVTIGKEGGVSYWNLKDSALLGSIFLLDSANFIFVDKRGYYMSTRAGTKSITFRMDSTISLVDQYDPYFNRPDIVLSELDSTSNKERIGLYVKLLDKRWKRDSLPPDPEFDYRKLPVLRIQNGSLLPLVSNKSKFDLELLAGDDRYIVQYLNLWINNVPVFGTKGMYLNLKAGSRKVIHLPVELSRGENKIEVSVLNSAHQESIRALQWITYVPKRP